MERELPEGWVEVELSKISLEVSKVTPENTPDEYFNYIDIASIDNEKNKVTEARSILGAEAPSRARQLVKEGDTVFSTVRTYLKNIAFITDEFDGSVASTGFAVIRPIEEIESKFVFYYTLSDLFLEPLNQLQRGISYPAVKSSVVFGQPFPLPPLAEQKRIVAKLDEAFQHLDTLKAKLERIPELLKNFRQAVLTQAVTGKLTEDWREENEVEPASLLIENVIQLRKERLLQPGIKKKSLKTESLEVKLRQDIDLFDIPDVWKWVNLEFLFDENDSFCYGVVQPGNAFDNGQKLIRVKDLYNSKVLHDELRTISFETDAEYKRSRVKAGDILISVVGTIGRTAIVTESEEGYNIARAVAKIPVSDFGSKYIETFLSSMAAQKWLVGDAREVARKTLNLDQLKTLPVPLPSLEEQKEIVKRVEALFAKADAIEGYYATLKEKIDKLPQALLAKAFRGELVPQNPNDEPASVLLENIKVAKAAAVKPAKGKKAKGGKQGELVL